MTAGPAGTRGVNDSRRGLLIRSGAKLEAQGKTGERGGGEKHTVEPAKKKKLEVHIKKKKDESA